MSKKHFQALAYTIADFNKDAPNIGQKQFTKRQIELLADFCYQQNGNFDKGRFLAACGLDK